jgi:hypothetical protein
MMFAAARRHDAAACRPVVPAEDRCPVFMPVPRPFRFEFFVNCRGLNVAMRDEVEPWALTRPAFQFNTLVKVWYLTFVHDCFPQIRGFAQRSFPFDKWVDFCRRLRVFRGIPVDPMMSPEEAASMFGEAQCLECPSKLKDPHSQLRGLCPPCTRNLGGDRLQQRNNCWEYHVGDRSACAPCACCEGMVTHETFRAAHIVACSLLGPSEPTNMVPACFSCDVAMGTDNLYAFRDELQEIRRIVIDHPYVVQYANEQWAALIRRKVNPQRPSSRRPHY